MLKRTENQIKDFSNAIKEVKGCDEMLKYLNSSIFATIKLLMFASTLFSVYIRVMFFFIISIAGLLVASMIGAIPASSSFLLFVTMVLFIIMLAYILQCRKLLAISIKEAKIKMENNQS